MPKIELTYAWSESRVKCLRECAWKYYLTYFLAWEGWLSHVAQEKRQAYTLKKMTNMPMFVGSVVHDIIEEIISNGRSLGKWISLEEAQNKAIQLLRRGWKQSTNKQWQDSPTHFTNLSEHYHNIEIEKDKLSSYKTKVLKSIKAFYDMPLMKIMQNLAPEAWLTIEEFQKFKMNTGEEVSVKIDCGFVHDNKVYLIDWKTGKVNDSVLDQLVTYAMYAMKQGWAKKPEDIIIVPVYLAAYSDLKDKATPHMTVSLDHIKRQASTIRNEYPLLSQAHEQRDNPDFFKRTENPNACRNCHFRTICPGARTEIEDGETPF